MTRLLVVYVRLSCFKVMNKKVILSIFVCIVIVGVSTFMIIDLDRNRDSLKEFKDTEMSEILKEELAETTETSTQITEESFTTTETVDDLTTLPVEDFGGPRPAGIIIVPVICKPKERLDPTTNKCKRVI
jgi:uncharacterized membrane protein